MASSNIPNIGVRLSADGVADVVAAFQRVQVAGVATGADITEDFTVATVAASALDAAVGVLEVSLGALAALLPAITFAAAVAGLGHMVSGSLESAEAIGKLSQKTGASVETLSTLAMVAGDAGVDMETFSGALVKLGKNQEEASNGNAKQLAAFKSLNITLADLKSLSPADLFVKMSESATTSADGPKKLQAALATMGKGASDLVPVLDRLGEDGFAKATEKARSLGLLLDQDTVNSARAAAEGFRELDDIAKGLATRFTSGFAPFLVQGIEELATEVEGHGVDSMKTLGEEAGRAFQYIVFGALSAKAAVILLFEDAMAKAKGLGSYWATLFNGIKSGSPMAALEMQQNYYAKVLPGLNQQLDQNSADFDARMADAKKYLNTPPTVRTYKKLPTAGADGDGTDAAQKTKTQDALAQFMESQAENLLGIQKAANAAAEAEDKRRYDAGLLTVDRITTRWKPAPRPTPTQR